MNWVCGSLMAEKLPIVFSSLPENAKEAGLTGGLLLFSRGVGHILFFPRGLKREKELYAAVFLSCIRKKKSLYDMSIVICLFLSF